MNTGFEYILDLPVTFSLPGQNTGPVGMDNFGGPVSLPGLNDFIPNPNEYINTIPLDFNDPLKDFEGLLQQKDYLTSIPSTPGLGIASNILDNISNNETPTTFSPVGMGFNPNTPNNSNSNIDFDPIEYIAGLGDLTPLLNDSSGSTQVVDNINEYTGTGQNTYNFLDQLSNVLNTNNNNGLGPDEFGSYVIPNSDPTFSTGSQYARSIASGGNVPGMIAPGMSYSAANPQGYTQMDLPPTVSGLPNIPKGGPPNDIVKPPSIGGIGGGGPIMVSPGNNVPGGGGINYGPGGGINYGPGSLIPSGPPVGNNVPGGGGISYTNPFDQVQPKYSGGPVSLPGLNDQVQPSKQYQPLNLSGIQNILDSLITFEQK